MHSSRGERFNLALLVLTNVPEAKAIFRDVRTVCGLSRVKVEAPHWRGYPAQCHRCQLYGHVAANCSAPPSGTLPVKSDVEAILALGGSVIMFGDFNSKHAEWTCRTTTSSGRVLLNITQSLDLTVYGPLAVTHYPDNVNYAPDVLDFALVKGVSLNLGAIESLDYLGSDHRPVSLLLGHQPSPTPTSKTYTNWKGFKKSLALAIDTPDPPITLSSDVLDSTGQIDTAVENLTSLITSSLKKNKKVVPVAKTSLSLDISNLLKAKKAALRRAARYPTPEYRLAAHRLQRKLRYRLQDYRDLERGNLMEKISPSHTAYYQIARALRIAAITHTPPSVSSRRLYCLRGRRKG
ncbi:unnamed protein product [Parnassius apollo]|uniref:(apollo) hypothetical protein n=1 Tax=Parnassius apollo TaxID=110799 RepID=A0A8S3XID2_PARAO|nr:unnamed protein product [Parnassius apollo]